MEQFIWPIKPKGLQSLIGFINWFLNFIPDLSQKIAYITDKLRENPPYTWNESEKEVINEIITCISKQSPIHHIQQGISFTIQTDASDRGISAILLQRENVVGIFSKKLSRSEINHTSMEKELLAILED